LFFLPKNTTLTGRGNDFDGFSSDDDNDRPTQTDHLNQQLLTAAAAGGIPAHFMAAGRGGEDDQDYNDDEVDDNGNNEIDETGDDDKDEPKEEEEEEFGFSPLEEATPVSQPLGQQPAPPLVEKMEETGGWCLFSPEYSVTKQKKR